MVRLCSGERTTFVAAAPAAAVLAIDPLRSRRLSVSEHGHRVAASANFAKSLPNSIELVGRPARPVLAIANLSAHGGQLALRTNAELLYCGSHLTREGNTAKHPDGTPTAKANREHI